VKLEMMCKENNLIAYCYAQKRNVAYTSNCCEKAGVIYFARSILIWVIHLI